MNGLKNLQTFSLMTLLKDNIMKRLLLCALFLVMAFPAFAYHPVQDVTQMNQKVCGLKLLVGAEKEGDLLKLKILIPASVCPESILLKQVILQILDKENDQAEYKILLACPLANFEGCDFAGKSLELRFNIDKDFVEKAYLLLHYGEEKGGVSYRVDIKTYLPEMNQKSEDRSQKTE